MAAVPLRDRPVSTRLAVHWPPLLVAALGVVLLGAAVVTISVVLLFTGLYVLGVGCTLGASSAS